MSKVRDLPEINLLEDNDLLYAVDNSAGVNGGRKITKANLKASVDQSPAEIKIAYESNADTNAFTDAEKTKLAGVESGATADQLASEVPYNNTISGISATNVQSAIDEVSLTTQADFRPMIVSGRILHYTGGTARFDDIFFFLPAGDILLNPSITNGEVYVDLDGIVKQTASGVNAPPLTIVFAKFSTDLNNIISLTDERVKNSQNMVRGVLSDVRDVRAGAASQAGNSGRISDAMHKHSILTGAVSTQTPDQVNAEGSSANLARADHIHELVTAAPSTNLSPAITNTQGVSTSFSRADHTHAIATALVADITTIQPDDTALAGVANTFARGDHKHAIAAAAPSTTLSPSTSNAEGASTSFARADHTHAIAASQAGDLSTINAGDAEILGSTDRFSRAGHQHPVATAAAIGLSPTTTNTEGVSTSLARADHTHTIAAAAAVTQAPDQANAEGTAAFFARADHIHNIPCDVAANTGSANAEGVSTSFSRADHTHNTTVVNSVASATDTQNTISTTDVLIPNMTLTPIAGTYLVTFAGTTVNSGNGAERNFFSIYAGGVKVAYSEQRVGISGGSVTPTNLQAIVTVNGSQSIQAQWRVVAGTGTIHERSLIAVRLGS